MTDPQATEKTPEQRWKEPLFQPFLSRCAAYRPRPWHIILLGAAAGAAPLVLVHGMLQLTCAIDCYTLIWLGAFGGPPLALGLFVTLMVVLFMLASRLTGRGALYLKIYLALVVLAEPFIAFRFRDWVFS